MSKIKITLQEVKSQMYPKIDGRINTMHYQHALEEAIKTKEMVDKACPYIHCRNRIRCYENGILCDAIVDMKEEGDNDN